MLNYTSLLEINDTVTVIRITIPKLGCYVILREFYMYYGELFCYITLKQTSLLERNDTVTFITIFIPKLGCSVILRDLYMYYG